MFCIHIFPESFEINFSNRSRGKLLLKGVNAFRGKNFGNDRFAPLPVNKKLSRTDRCRMTAGGAKRRISDIKIPNFLFLNKLKS